MNTEKGENQYELQPNPSGYDRRYIQKCSETQTQEEYQKTDNALTRKWEKLFDGDNKDNNNPAKGNVSLTDKAVENARTEILFEKVVKDIQFYAEHSEEKKSLITLLEESLEGEKNREISYSDVFVAISRIEQQLKERVQHIRSETAVSDNTQDTEEIVSDNTQDTEETVSDDTHDTEETLSENELPVTNDIEETASDSTDDEIFGVQEKIVIVNKKTGNQKYTYNEKIKVLQKILDSHISDDEDFNRHIRNKIKLLIKVRDSGYVMQELPPKKKRQSSTQTTVPSQQDKTAQKRQQNIIQLTKTIEQYRTKQKKILEIAHSHLISADDKVSMIMEMELAESKISPDTPKQTENIVTLLEKRKTVTKEMVHRTEYFKFGAGAKVCFGEFQMTLPSNYSVSETMREHDYVIAISDIIRQSKAENLITSPLVIAISKNKQKLCDSYHEFFSSNINYCNRHNIKYRQSVVSGFPCVFKHKDEENGYTVSVYNTAKHYIIDICFEFHVRCDNKDSIVKRILSGITINRK
ncbi:MAG: hypothetical protein IJU14_05020 [Clostridia bacterium]|nr:hypothetical protein [Clostridia bacterium]